MMNNIIASEGLIIVSSKAFCVLSLAVPLSPSKPSMEPQTTAGLSKPLKPKTKGKKLSEQEKAERRRQRKIEALEK